jgi:hypothetical protein
MARYKDYRIKGPGRYKIITLKPDEPSARVRSVSTPELLLQERHQASTKPCTLSSSKNATIRDAARAVPVRSHHAGDG